MWGIGACRVGRRLDPGGHVRRRRVQVLGSVAVPAVRAGVAFVKRAKLERLVPATPSLRGGSCRIRRPVGGRENLSPESMSAFASSDAWLLTVSKFWDWRRVCGSSRKRYGCCWRTAPLSAAALPRETAKREASRRGLSSSSLAASASSPVDPALPRSLGCRGCSGEGPRRHLPLGC